ncbi:hypothetical protein QE450_003612 [Paenibacillus sp. SORGH_AS306]|uniref:hypothetical protein n=1 Tax=unclassified Paenibacillus TaxID=185978 RepID=UPI0027884568|nr:MULTISPECIES: hypothetical protein [unclassified Paenibacillus]MDQ1236114.1 hypothetical protein [Paenibacillus sp. SORGH_AS_0306]MDR6108469.1 hypothetical protein [Paenibacillus sp. SORGH_AS_0338]
MTLRLFSLKKNSLILKSTCTYTPSIRTFNIVTKHMNDECIPYQIGVGICIWLNELGAMGEIELIYPKQTSKHNFFEPNSVEKIIGEPIFSVSETDYDNVTVEISQDNFVIWLKSKSEFDLKIISENIYYLFQDNKLVAIGSEFYDTIE